jgi:type II secretory pathway component GspD/PulD (secretin)
MPEPLAFDRLQMIPVKNTSAAVMERMLHDLYGNQIESVSIEERTNSLIVMTSPAMFEQIKRVVDLLDEQAGGSRRDRTDRSIAELDSRAVADARHHASKARPGESAGPPSSTPRRRTFPSRRVARPPPVAGRAKALARRPRRN